jgi:hypothetical protein
VDKNDETYGEDPSTSKTGRKAKVAPAASKDYDEKIVSLVYHILINVVEDAYLPSLHPSI